MCVCMCVWVLILGRLAGAVYSRFRETGACAHSRFLLILMHWSLWNHLKLESIRMDTVLMVSSWSLNQNAKETRPASVFRKRLKPGRSDGDRVAQPVSSDTPMGSRARDSGEWNVQYDTPWERFDAPRRANGTLTGCWGPSEGCSPFLVGVSAGADGGSLALWWLPQTSSVTPLFWATPLWGVGNPHESVHCSS